MWECKLYIILAGGMKLIGGDIGMNENILSKWFLENYTQGTLPVTIPRDRNIFPLKEGSVYYRYLKSVSLRIHIIATLSFVLKTGFPFVQVPFQTGVTVLCESLDAFCSTQGPVRALTRLRQ
jgi:hypothetical protein